MNQSKNPFDDSSAESQQNIPANPFDDSSDDDDSYFYEECNEEESESYLSETTASTIIPTTTATQQQQLNYEAIAIGDNNSQNASIANKSETSKKRPPPLSFGVRAVIAKPALNFGSTQTSSRGIDFVSPLETAMINQVDHLKSAKSNPDSSSDDDDEDDDDEDEDEEDLNDSDAADHHGDKKAAARENYRLFSARGLSSFFFSSPVKEDGDHHQKDDEGGADCIIEAKAKDDDGVSESRERSYSETGITIASSFDNTTISNDDAHDRLAEAKQVLERMDTLKKQLKKEANARKRILKALLKKQQEEKNVLKKIDSHPKDSALTMDHRHSASPWNRLLLLEELGTASSWVILLLPYLAFLLANFLDGNSGLWEVTSSPMSTSLMCNDVMNLPLVQELSTFPITPLPNDPCSYKYQLLEGEGLLSHVGRNIDVVDKEYRRQMSTGVAFTSGPMTDIPVLSAFLFG